MVYIIHSELSDEELEKRKYVFPEERKFPLPDKAHVLSAIKFFNYVEPSKEKILARAILRRMKEYGMGPVQVGEKNRFLKYYHPSNRKMDDLVQQEDKKMGNYCLAHSAKGQTWKNHKYIAIKNGRYIYPEDVTGVGNARQLEKEAMKQVQAKQQQNRAAAKANKQAEASKRQSEQNQQSARANGATKKTAKVTPKAEKFNAFKSARDNEKGHGTAAYYKVRDMHGWTDNGARRSPVESGNIPLSKEDRFQQQEAKIYRQSDVNQKAIMAYSKINGFKKTVQKYGEKGKAFLLALFKKK